MIDLTNVNARAFEWGLEHDCRVKWHGPGFRYGHWSTLFGNWHRLQHGFVGSAQMPGSDQADPAVDVVDQIKGWREQMWSDDYQSLNTIAAYLTRLGENVDARKYLLEARRQQHVGDYHPWEALAWATALPASLASSVGWQWDAFRDVILALYLWPTGFGAQPEWALYSIIVMMFVGAAVYKVYVFWATPREELRHAVGLSARSSMTSGRAPLAHAPSYGQQGEPAAARPASRPTAWRAYSAAALRPVKSLVLFVAWICVPDRSKPVWGFEPYDRAKHPKHLSVVAFSIDACLPVVSLNVYDHFYPSSRAMRGFSFFQRLWGWWMATVFVASATVLA